MYPERRSPLLISALALLIGGLGACDDDPASEAAPSAPDAGISADAEAPGEAAVVESLKQQVRFKGGARLAVDLADALALPRDQLCTELGQYDCVDEVHRIVLGGVEPYSLGIRTPLPVAPATAPMAADRVALAACAERWRRDQADLASGVLAQDLPDAPGADWLDARATDVITRVLRRDPLPSEVAALVDLHGALKAEGGATGDWLVLSCFTAATSLESLFY